MFYKSDAKPCSRDYCEQGLAYKKVDGYLRIISKVGGIKLVKPTSGIRESFPFREDKTSR